MRNPRNFIDTVVTNSHNRNVEFVPSRVVEVTPDDSEILQPGVLFVGAGGDVTVIPADNTGEVTFKNVPDGSFLPVLVKAVFSTDTTADDILICY